MDNNVINILIDTFVTKQGENQMKAYDSQIIELKIQNNDEKNKNRINTKTFSKMNKMRMNIFGLDKETWIVLDFGKSIREYFQINISEELIDKYEENLKNRGVGLYFQIQYDDENITDNGNIYKIRNDEAKSILEKIKAIKNDGINTELKKEDAEFDTDAKIYRFARQTTFFSGNLNSKNQVILPITEDVKIQVQKCNIYEEVKEENWIDAEYENIMEYIQGICDNVKEKMDNDDDYRIHIYSFFSDNVNLLENGNEIMDYKNHYRMVKR